MVSTNWATRNSLVANVLFLEVVNSLLEDGAIIRENGAVLRSSDYFGGQLSCTTVALYTG
jgi:hypothetical protein